VGFIINERKMKSIERRYNKISQKNYLWSSHTSFALAIAGQNFSKESIYEWFNKLVDKDDYDKRDKFEVLNSLVSLSRGVKAPQIDPLLAQKGVVNIKVDKYPVVELIA
jgi:hypothetical protein